MQSIILIPWAETEWTSVGRLTAGMALPLTESGRRQAESWGQQLADLKLKIVYTSDELTAQETGALVSEAARARLKSLDGVEEVDFGLWEGLNEETLKARFPKVYKRWVEDPAAVCPPDGEELPLAMERIRKGLSRAAKKASAAPVGVVLGPMACAVARCVLENVDPSAARQYLTSEPMLYVDVDKEKTTSPAPAHALSGNGKVATEDELNG